MTRPSLVELVARSSFATALATPQTNELLALWAANYEQAYTDACGTDLLVVVAALGADPSELPMLIARTHGAAMACPDAVLREHFPLSSFTVVRDARRKTLRALVRSHPFFGLYLPLTDADEMFLLRFGTRYEDAYEQATGTAFYTVIAALGVDPGALCSVLLRTAERDPAQRRARDALVRERFPFSSLPLAR